MKIAIGAALVLIVELFIIAGPMPFTVELWRSCSTGDYAGHYLAGTSRQGFLSGGPFNCAGQMGK